MAQSNGNGTTCKTCGGRGMIATPNGRMFQQCPTCGGAGTAPQNVIRVPWTLPPFNVPLTALQQNVPVVVQQDSDADFEWIYTMSTCINADGSAGLYAVQLQDQSTGRNLSGGFINGENFAGSAQLPFVLPEPYLISRTATIRGNFNSRVAGQATTVQLVLHGYKLFPASAPMQGSAGAIVQANP